MDVVRRNCTHGSEQPVARIDDDSNHDEHEADGDEERRHVDGLVTFGGESEPGTLESALVTAHEADRAATADEEAHHEHE